MAVTSFDTDIRGLQTKAERDGEIAVSTVLSDWAKNSASGNSRIAFSILEAVEKTGLAFVADVLPVYQAAVPSKVDGSHAKTAVRAGIDGYLMVARSWGRSQPEFSDSRNGLLDRDFPRIEAAVSAELERELRKLDYNVKPWSERADWKGRLAILAGLGGTMGIVAAVVALAHSFGWIGRP